MKLRKYLGKFVSAAAALLTAVSLAGCAMTERDEIEVTREAEVPPHMLFLGDSIAAGYGLDGYTSEDNYSCPSYSNLLFEQYKAELPEEAVPTMINKAVSGATSADLLGMIESGELDRELKESDAVVVSIGGNDLLDILYKLFDSVGYSPENSSFSLDDLDLFSAASVLYGMGSEADEAIAGFSENLKAIAAGIHERTDAVLYIKTLYDPLEYYSYIPLAADFSSEKISDFNSVVRENAAAGLSDYRIADVFEKFTNRSADLTNMADFDIHPNAEGHKVIASVVDSAFRDTGFTYTVTEPGEEHLTQQAKAIIIGGIAALLLVIIIAAFAAGRKKGNTSQK